MRNPLQFVLLVLSMCCFALAAWQTEPSPRWNRIVAVGATLFVASQISW